MRFLTGEQRAHYLEKYPIHDFFSFDISPYIHVCQFDKGEFIFQEGSHPDYIYYMVEGRAKLYLTHKNGKVSLINFLTSSNFMGEMELFYEEKYTKGIQTVTSSICIAISSHECKQKLLEDPVFLKTLCIFLSKKSTAQTFKLTQNQAYPLEHRLAAFILLSSDNGFYKEKHTEVCEYLGVSYRHLLFLFAQFCEDKLIEKYDRGYKILNVENLETLASEIQ